MSTDKYPHKGDSPPPYEDLRRNGSVSSSEGGTPSEIIDSVPDITVVDDSMSMTTRYITVAVLFLVNLLNYMDRYTIAGVLDDVKTYYKIGNTNAGLVQAVYIIGYMVFSPIFGYCGDRYSRKYLMLGGIAFWSSVTFAGSFVTPQYFGVFVFLRGLVGIGEASYSTLAPTLISDMFVKSKRSAMLMIFYFAIPVGSGLGYIVGSSVAHALGHWYWALRVTPGLGIVCCILIFFVSKDPPRGMAEHASTHLRSMGVWHDIKALCKNKSFMFDTGGFVCVAFVAGALALFAPSFIYKAYKIQHIDTPESTVSLYFGIVTCSAGFVGIIFGSGLAYLAKKRFPNGDALVCAAGLIVASITLFLGIYVLEHSVAAAWVLIFLSMTFVCMNWSLTADILLYTVVPIRRSTAEAMNIFVGHLLGDAGSPYLLGVLSDHLHATGMTPFKAMQNSLYSCAIVSMIGGILFVCCSFFIESDRAKADAITHGATEQEAGGIILPDDDADDSPLLISS